MSRVLVIGAGVTGLACGHALHRAGVDVSVIDGATLAGGVMGTIEIDGFRFETGPNTIQASSTTFRDICGELGIADELIVARSSSRIRYLYFRGALKPIPTNPLAFLSSPLLSVPAKLRVLSEPLRRHVEPADGVEPSLEEFLTQRIGREATRTLAGAFVRGIYAAEIDELGALSAFPRLYTLARKHGSLFRGALKSARERRRAGDRPAPPGPDCPRSELLSFRTGLGRFVECLSDSLGERLRLGKTVEGLARDGGLWRATLAGGEQLGAETVVLAVPARPTLSLLKSAAREDLDVRALEEIRHAAVTLVHLGIETRCLPPGFGFLVPPDEAGPGAPTALGVLFGSSLFGDRAPRGMSAVTAIYRSGDILGKSDEEVVQTALDDLALATGKTLSEQPTVTSLLRWEGVIPRYSRGHGQRMERFCANIEGQLPGLHLAGSYTGGISVEDCLCRGRAVAAALASPKGISEEHVA